MSLVCMNRGGFRYSNTDKWAFRNVALCVEAGESARVTGRNGSGKSTLLKILSGLMTLTEGEISMGVDWKAAYMDQFAGEMLSRELTISEHFKAASAPIVRDSISPTRLLDEFGLELHLHSFVGHLSGGERQIVALLCTLASGASLLCLDEFTSSLDDRSALVAEQLISRALSTGDIALVVVSHGDIGTRVDRTIMMHRTQE
jgi:ABC-type multidrug transport system ATPase subunit